jgi:hypothetical protein
LPLRVSVGEERGDAAHFDDRRGAREGEHHRHLEKDAEEVADVVGAVLGEALGAIAALQQEGLAVRDPRQRLLEAARLAGKHQRRKGPELLFGLGQHGTIRIIRHLQDRLIAPAVGRPTFGHGRPRLSAARAANRFNGGPAYTRRAGANASAGRAARPGGLRQPKQPQRAARRTA